MGYFLSLSKGATEHCLDASEWMLLVCGLVLAYGAAGEYLEEHDKLPIWMRWSRKPKLVFVWMVAISLFGEFAGDAGVSLFSSHLQSIADQEIKDANSKALDAKNSAEGASAAAGMAVDSLVIVGKEAGDAQGKAGRAKSEAEAVGKNVSLAQKQLSKILLYTAHRFIDMKSIAEATKAFPKTLFLIRLFPDTDSELLAGQIMHALGDPAPSGAGWTPLVWKSISIDDARFTEVYVDHANGLADVPNPEPGCQALVKAMEANSVGPTMSNGTRHPKDPNLVVITIGIRGLEWAPPSEKIKNQILNRQPASRPPTGAYFDPCAPDQ
jgi:hypothetical protein